ncbi:MAG: trimethylamine methyltransferase family protein [Deltaproteobacteria bacterium]|nr:trimethylamine methyltransferase family protein [Deltaproteobacteria bacterium]
METSLNHLCVPRFELLDESQILRLHHAALRILGEVGVKVNHQRAVDLLAGHGKSMPIIL